MKIIAFRTLRAFFEKPEHADSAVSSRAWYHDAKTVEWKNSNELKKAILFLLLTIIALITFTSCVKEDDKEDEIIVETGNYFDHRDGRTYKWVKIGDQVWMAENLKFLPSIVGTSIDSHTAPFYYVYDYEGTDVDAAKATSNYQTYGVLYNWIASLNACPQGWHLPSHNEWMQLTEKVGRNPGTKLKARNGWYGSGNGLDSYGFTALPGGGRYQGDPQNYFGFIEYYGHWWVVNESEAPNAAWFAVMDIYGSGIGWGFAGYKGNGFSIRCLKD